jgi:hypothetical protein
MRACGHAGDLSAAPLSFDVTWREAERERRPPDPSRSGQSTKVVGFDLVPAWFPGWGGTHATERNGAETGPPLSMYSFRWRQSCWVFLVTSSKVATDWIGHTHTRRSTWEIAWRPCHETKLFLCYQLDMAGSIHGPRRAAAVATSVIVRIQKKKMKKKTLLISSAILQLQRELLQVKRSHYLSAAHLGSGCVRLILLVWRSKWLLGL